MTRLSRSARGLVVAVAALALTGGAVFATMPAASAPGLARAAAASGKTVPVIKPQGQESRLADERSTTEDKTEQVETPETPETPEAPDADAPDVDAATTHPDNHGAVVSAAAKAATPDGFDTHGAYVSSIAKSSAGKPDAATKAADKAAAGNANGDAGKALGSAKGAAARAARGH